MAKDKTKTKDAKPKGGADDFAKPSDAPAGGDSWNLTEAEGALLLFTPLRKDVADVKRGSKSEEVDIIVADVVVINEKKPEKSDEHEDVWVFPKWVQGALRGYIGERKVLGRLVKAEDKASAVGYVWKLEDATEDDVAAARAYVDSIDPFKVKASDVDGEKPAKKKKAKA